MKKRKIKLLVAIDNINRALEHEWFVTYLNQEIFELEFLLINCRDSDMSRFLNSQGIPVHHLTFSGKHSIPYLVAKIIKLLLSRKYDIVHTHLFLTSLIVMPVAWLCCIKKRIMTRHHSDFHHIWFPSALKYDKFTNWFTTDIVAISKVVYDILVKQENVDEKKVTLIHHGIDLSNYIPLSKDSSRVISIRQKYNLKERNPVIGVISRFIELKGIQYIIPAFKKILTNHPNAVLVLANAEGEFADEINRMLNTLPEESYRKIDFEKDITALFSSFDCFVHVPVSSSAEAFGQIYIESMALRVPSVFTLSGILSEFGKDGSNCFTVPYRDPEAIHQKIIMILSNPETVQKVVEQAQKDANDLFTFDNKIRKLEKLYLKER